MVSGGKHRELRLFDEFCRTHVEPMQLAWRALAARYVTWTVRDVYTRVRFSIGAVERALNPAGDRCSEAATARKLT